MDSWISHLGMETAKIFTKYIILIFLTALCFSLVLPRISPGADKSILFEGDSIYNHITIRKNDTEYCMLFGRYADNRETCIDMKQPGASIFEYTAMMFVGFLFQPDTQSINLIGLGGGYIPMVFHRHLPSVSLHTVEIDPLVLELAVKYFHFTVPANHRLTIADGRQHLRRNTERYDQIWIDAFNSDYIPAHMTTKEFLLMAKSRLKENGIIVQNIHGGNKLYDAQVTTFKAAFARVFIFEGHRSDNRIIVASDSPRFEPPNLQHQAAGFKGKIGSIDLLEELKKYTPRPEIRKAPVLTDDFNPANLMLHQR